MDSLKLAVEQQMPSQSAIVKFTLNGASASFLVLSGGAMSIRDAWFVSGAGPG